MLFDNAPDQKAVFLDKDGTLIRNVPYNINPELVVFEQGVFEGLRSLQHNGYKLIIVSNQPGISLGYFSENEMVMLIRYFEEKFAENEVLLSGFYFCPHLPESAKKSCQCRKPKPGLLMQAADDLLINRNSSWMIGDILNDVEAGNKAGCQTILIDNGNETEWITGVYREADYTTGNFLDAAAYITSRTVMKDEKK